MSKLLCAECGALWGTCPHSIEAGKDFVTLACAPEQVEKIQSILRGERETEEEISVRLLHVLEELSIGYMPKNVAFRAHFEGGPGEPPKVLALEPSKLEGVFDAILQAWREQRDRPIYTRLREEVNRAQNAYFKLLEFGEWFKKVRKQLADHYFQLLEDRKKVDPGKQSTEELAREEGRKEMLGQCEKAFTCYKDAAPLHRVEKAGAFKIGHYYGHAGGQLMHILCSVKTALYGECLVAELTNEANLRPVGTEPEHRENWREVTKMEWLSHFED